MKLLKKIGEFALVSFGAAAGLFFLVVPLLYIIGAAVTRHLIPECEHNIACWVEHPAIMPMYVLTATVGLVTACGVIFTVSAVHRTCKTRRERRRKIEDEIKTVSEIQIAEPAPPDPVERFYGDDGPIEKFFERYFSWTEDAGDRLRELLEALPLSVKCVGVLTIGFVVGAVTLWIYGASFQEVHWGLMILFAILVGFFAIYCAVWLVWAVLLVILLPLAAPYYGWRAAKSVNAWLAQNLPRRIVVPYRSWQLRHVGKRRVRCTKTAFQLATVTIVVLIALYALKLISLIGEHSSAGCDGDDCAEARAEQY